MTCATRNRWIAALTMVAALSPLPYTISRVIWAVGIPFGIDASMLHDDFQAPGWGSLQILLIASLCEGTALYTYVFLRKRPCRVPDWIPLLAGRPVRPWAVALPLLAPIAILNGFNVWGVGLMFDGFVIPDGNGGLPGWSFWSQLTVFLVWGTTLTLATVAYLVQTRSWSTRAL